jgi:hypothetical protein
MSETNEEFGKWLKQRGQYVWRPKKGHPYVVRWEGDPGSDVQLDSTGRYQLSRGVSGLWAAGFIGSLDNDGEELTGEPGELSQAQAACQAHADGGRAGQ